MNKANKISQRAQQKFISGEQTTFLIKALRLCPCSNEVGCVFCGGLGQYYDDPVIIKGILANGRNSSQKKTEFPELDLSEYELTIHPNFSVAKGDRVIPFNLNLFETFEERIDKGGDLSFHPARAVSVQIYFKGDNKIIPYKNGVDFSISKGTKNLINSKTITWINPPPYNRDKFIARYQRIPEYVIGEIPEAKISDGRTIMKTFTLKKLLAPSETATMTSSGEKASSTITKGGMSYE